MAFFTAKRLTPAQEQLIVDLLKQSKAGVDWMIVHYPKKSPGGNRKQAHTQITRYNSGGLYAMYNKDGSPLWSVNTLLFENLVKNKCVVTSNQFTPDGGEVFLLNAAHPGIRALLELYYMQYSYVI